MTITTTTAATPPAQVFDRFGVLFRDLGLLTLALTHSSKNRDQNNERLEFLGDRVIGLILADILYRHYPDEAEGQLALRHAALVRAEMLATLARALDLEPHLILGASDRGPRGIGHLENVLADAVEALLGALYLDSGLGACEKVISALWGDAMKDRALPPQDPKTALQEWAQARGLPLPVYKEMARTGPHHAPIFTIKVSVKGHGSQKAEGASRRAGEKLAAAALLEKLQSE